MNHPQKATCLSRPSRRQVLKSAGATTAAMLAAGSAPALLYAQDRSGSAEIIIGKGEFSYRCLHDWGMKNLPDGHNYGNTMGTHGVAVDEAGLIYITHYGNPGSIFVFDGDGKFVRAMGPQHRTANDSTGAGHGIDIRTEDAEQFIYLSPSESHLPFSKMNMKGEIVWNRGRAEIDKDCGGLYGEKGAYRPTNISFSPDGGYFLGDGYGSNYLHQYDRQDKYIRTIGGSGKEDGKFQTPHGQWLDERDDTPKLVVCDRANARLQWFDMEGHHLKTQDGLYFPADIDIRGDLMLVPDLHCVVFIYDKDNNKVAELGDDPEIREQKLRKNDFSFRGQRDKWRPGKFVHPHDACFDHEGNIYVAEWVATGRVTKLQRIS